MNNTSFHTVCLFSVCFFSLFCCNFPGVHSALVALIAMKAEIIYEPTLITVKQLIKKIEELGFSATLLEQHDNLHGNTGRGTIHFTVSMD